MALWFSMISNIMPYDKGFGEEFGAFSWIFSGAAIIFFPIFYGVFGFVGGIICASLYNLFTKWVGGIKIERTEQNMVNES
ncbi:hypothetical protein ACFLWR_07365 [Chloroflexota bacterium]